MSMEREYKLVDGGWLSCPSCRRCLPDCECKCEFCGEQRLVDTEHWSFSDKWSCWLPTDRLEEEEAKAHRWNELNTYITEKRFI